jgi:hypothetical protein
MAHAYSSRDFQPSRLECVGRHCWASGQLYLVTHAAGALQQQCLRQRELLGLHGGIRNGRGRRQGALHSHALVVAPAPSQRQSTSFRGSCKLGGACNR